MEKRKSENKEVNMRKGETQDSKGKREKRGSEAGYGQGVDYICSTMPLVIVSSLSCLNRCARIPSTHYTT